MQTLSHKSRFPTKEGNNVTGWKWFAPLFFFCFFQKRENISVHFLYGNDNTNAIQHVLRLFLSCLRQNETKRYLHVFHLALRCDTQLPLQNIKNGEENRKRGLKFESFFIIYPTPSHWPQRYPNNQQYLLVNYQITEKTATHG